MILSATTGGMGGMLIMWAAVIGIFYFMLIRPQQKESKEKTSMLAELAVGDTILTTSGFYGVVIDIDEDTVIVEFGSNRNCRIPMKKDAIAASEKPESATKDSWAADKKK